MSSTNTNNATLHILNKSPGHPRFRACLAAIGDEDMLLLTENAVLALAEHHISLPQRVRALLADCQARGIEGDEVPTVDSQGMVALTDHYSRIISW